MWGLHFFLLISFSGCHDAGWVFFGVHVGCAFQKYAGYFFGVHGGWCLERHSGYFFRVYAGCFVQAQENYYAHFGLV